MPESALDLVSRFCEMAPGVPWSNLILDDVLENLKRAQGFEIEKVGEEAVGFHKVRSILQIQETENKKPNIKVIVICVQWLKDGPPLDEASGGTYRISIPEYQEQFPHTREGLKAAIQALRQATQNVLRRKPCYECPPRKRQRLCVGAAGICGECLVSRCLK